MWFQLSFHQEFWIISNSEAGMWAAQSWRVQQSYQNCCLVCKSFRSDKENLAAEEISGNVKLAVKPEYCFATQTVERKTGKGCNGGLSSDQRIDVNKIQEGIRHPLVWIRDEEVVQESSRGRNQNFPFCSTISYPLNPSPSPKLEELLLYLVSIGADEMKVVAKYPSIGKHSLQEVKSVASYLGNLGLKRNELDRIINMCPQILGRDVEGHLKPTVKFLMEEVGLSRDRLPKAINRCPRLLVCNLDEQLRQSMRYLKSLGFKGMEWVVSSNPALLTSSKHKKLVPKLQFLQSLGMTYEEAVSMVIRLPSLFNYSVEGNLRVKHDYLINVMHRDLYELYGFPQFFAFSLAHRIRPRHEFLSKHNIRLSLPNMLKMKEKHFRAMYTKGVPKCMIIGDL